ncbi:MAG: hypothetical protein RH862_00730 [Leptospiraceae bacterium]
MKRKSTRILILMLIFSPGCTAAPSIPGPVDRGDVPLKIQKLTKHIRLVQDGNYWGANSLYYVSEDSIFFLDGTYLPGTAGRIIWKSMTEGYGDFKGVVITSYHIHRTGGLSAFHSKNIPVIASIETERQIRRRWHVMDQQMSLFSSWSHPPMPLISETIKRDGTLFDGKVEVIALPPGYSPGNTAYFFPEGRVLYAGSLLSIPLYFDGDVNEESMLKALSILRHKKPSIVIAGHGEPIHGPEFLDSMESYVRARMKNR